MYVNPFKIEHLICVMQCFSLCYNIFDVKKFTLYRKKKISKNYFLVINFFLYESVSLILCFIDL